MKKILAFIMLIAISTASCTKSGLNAPGSHHSGNNGDDNPHNSNGNGDDNGGHHGNGFNGVEDNPNSSNGDGDDD